MINSLVFTVPLYYYKFLYSEELSNQDNSINFLQLFLPLGIGRGIAIELANLGAQVVCLDISQSGLGE